MLFIEESSPPPFYQKQLSKQQRTELDKWFIGKRSQDYYLKRFDEFDKQGYLSPAWHWAAFIATFGWLLYRKRYIDTIVYTIAGWSFIQLNIVIALVSAEFLFVAHMNNVYQMPVRIGIALIIWIFWSVMVARWTDAYYYRMARREIADVLKDYPNDPVRQKQHLQREGGVSQLGLVVAFAIFFTALIIIQIQFMPLYAKPKAEAIIQNIYEAARISSNQLEKTYQQHGYCNADASQLAHTTYGKLSVHTESTAMMAQQSNCVVKATIMDIPFPNRNLNGQTIIMFRPIGSQYSRWNCQTSLSDKLKPLGCLSETEE